MYLLPLLVACGGNILETNNFFTDGERQALGTAGSSDTATDTASGDSGGGGDTSETVDDAAPVIRDAFAESQELETGDQAYIVTLVVTDAQSDLVGGKVFYDFVPARGTTQEKTLIIKEAATAGPTDAAWDGSQIRFGDGPVDLSGGATVDAIIVRDAAGHESAEAALALEAPSR
jgi:hypothetical protein